MIRLQKNDWPTYVLSYTRWVRLGRAGLVVLLLGAAVVRWALAWVHFVLPIIQGAGGSAPILQRMAAQPMRPLLAAHVGLLLAAGAVAVVYAFLPDLGLADGGLAVRTLRGWWLVPWTTIKTVRIASLKKPRRLVLIQGRWTRWTPWPRLVSICLGAGFEPGLLLPSALRDFGPLMERLYHEVKRAAPEAVFDAEFLPAPLLLALEPIATLADLVEQAREEGWPPAISAQTMAAVPAGLILVQALLLILIGGAWWKPLAIAGLSAVEWGIGALYLYALAEVFPAGVELRQAALLYPLPQMPRALLSLPMAMFAAAGLPFLTAIAGLVGILWAVTLTALLVQQLFRLQSVLPTMPGALCQALFLFLVLALILTR